ncbi:hypothetical protein V5P93_002169 [Actinokineospora auranticolor]|uniref:WYL domain-containing protein n=1 Tax=Actinokineospora auranticolor TaxID=155976 RepID=A0A2S6GEU3_9PSEU|nr:WYL domain-containing protein [Actinokineospora auranticolor]PPK63743.1 hypothetical protein CLV40_12578 [Actinokineospora auranticolor]
MDGPSTGLTHDEALALLVAGARRGARAFGLGPALASAMRKVVDALPEGSRATAAGAVQRLLVDPETDLLSRGLVAEEVPDAVLAAIRRAVVAGHRLRIRYAVPDQAAKWRTVDPIGLVTVREQGVVATRHERGGPVATVVARRSARPRRRARHPLRGVALSAFRGRNPNNPAGSRN